LTFAEENLGRYSLMKPTQERIRHFIDDIVLPRANPLPGVPEELRGDWSSDDGWYSWKAIPSPVSWNDLAALEQRFGIKFPPLFSAYFLYKQILDGDYGIVRMPDMRPPSPLQELESQMMIYFKSPSLQAHNLIPFGQDGNDGGPICFKTDLPTPEGDYPVYFTDHERLSDSKYAGEERWGSFESLITAIEADMISYDA